MKYEACQTRATKATDADVAIARLQEMVRHLGVQNERLLKHVETMSYEQQNLREGLRSIPELKKDVHELCKDITRLKRTMANIRWFFMGAGAAFGFLGGAVSESVRGAIKVFMGG